MDWLNSNAGAVTAIATLVLVAITGFYAWRTHTIANETRTLAAETRKMVVATEDMVRQATLQHRDSSRPVIVFALAPGTQGAEHFKVIVTNAGRGPALDVELGVNDQRPWMAYHCASTRSTLPTAIGQGQAIECEFHDARFERGAPVPEAYQQMSSPGVLQATYRDIYSRMFLSEVTLVCGPPLPGLDPVPTVTLGAMRFVLVEG
jgi:hypothetical protein